MKRAITTVGRMVEATEEESSSITSSGESEDSESVSSMISSTEAFNL